MRSEAEVQIRIEDFRNNLNMVLEKTKAEMDKPYISRDYNSLKFLNREKNVWEFALQQMEWVLASE